MNNQRRHELEHNVLAGYLGNVLSKVQHLLKPLAIAAIAGGIAYAGYSLYQGMTAKKSSTAWTEYYFNLEGDANSFEELARNHGSSSAGQWARFSAATGFLRDGIDALYVNRQEGVGNIEKAIEELEKLKGSTIKELGLQVTQALGKAHESLGQLPEAIGYYEQLADSTALTEDERKQIDDRLTYLRTDDAKSFYAWFEKLDPKPTSPPQMPGDLSVPPSSPSLQFDPAEMPQLPEGAEIPPVPEEPAKIDVPEIELPEAPALEPPADAPVP